MSNEEIQSGEVAPESTEAPAGSGAEQQETLDRALEAKPKPPSFEPSPGTRHVFDSKRGMWVVERDDREDTLATEKAASIPDAKKEEGQETTPSVELPDILPDYVRDSPEIQSLVADAASALTSGGEYNNEAVQRVVDLVAQFELEVGAEQPNLHEKDRIRSMLRARWGEHYEGRLGEVNKYVNARPALKAYLNKTGAGNQLSVLEALGMVACGEMSHKPEVAAQILETMRRDPKSALRDPYHKGHRLAVQQAKVLADVVDRRDKFVAKKGGTRRANVEEMVDDRTAKEPAADSPEGKLDAELKTLRQSPAYFDKSRPEHKAIVERVRQLYRERYPS
jgi:hypothetical protein